MSATSAAKSESKPSGRERGMFETSLQRMMYGYGDDHNPLPETVALVEDILVEYVTNLMHNAQDVASNWGRQINTEDILFVIRKDLPKLNRWTKLLAMNEEINRVKKGLPI